MEEKRQRKPGAIFVGLYSEEFNQAVAMAASVNFDLSHLQGAQSSQWAAEGLPREVTNAPWDAIIIAFSPEDVTVSNVRRVLAAFPNRFYYFVYPNDSQPDDVTRFVNGFLDGLTVQRRVGTLEYFEGLIASLSDTMLHEGGGKSSAVLSAVSGCMPETTAEEISIAFDPSLTAGQIEATLTVLANYYRACGGVGLPANFESQEATVLVDSHV